MPLELQMKFKLIIAAACILSTVAAQAASPAAAVASFCVYNNSDYELKVCSLDSRNLNDCDDLPVVNMAMGMLGTEGIYIQANDYHYKPGYHTMDDGTLVANQGQIQAGHDYDVTVTGVWLFKKPKVTVVETTPNISCLNR